MAILHTAFSQPLLSSGLLAGRGAKGPEAEGTSGPSAESLVLVS